MYGTAGEQARRWMTAVWGPLAPLDEYVEIAVKKSNGRWMPQHSTLADALDAADRNVFPEIARFGSDVYAGMVGLIDVPERGRGSSALRGHATAVWIDLDCLAPGRDSAKMFLDQDEAWRAVDASVLGAPHVVVDSGWGIHACWLLAEPVEAVDVSAAVRALARTLREQTGRHVDEVSDLTRVLRLPGTQNWRGGESAARDVTLLRCQDRDERPGLTWNEVRIALGVTMDEIRAAREAASSVLGRSYNPEDRAMLDAGSLFEETVSWGTVLGTHGWHQIPGGPGEECWLRPGVSPRDNHTRSGVIYTERGGGLMVVFSDAPEVGLVSLRRSGHGRTGAGIGVIDKWRAWCDLSWGSDRMSAAQDAIERAWDDLGPGTWPEEFYEALKDECDFARAWAIEQRRRAIKMAVRGW